MHKETSQVCTVSGERFPASEIRQLVQLRPAVAALILKDHPELAPNAPLSLPVINRYRQRYVENLLLQEKGELSDLELQVAKSLVHGDLISKNIEDDLIDQRSLGEKLSDVMANFGGSWAFLISFATLLGVWILFNSKTSDIFDPYPFILLNLILSCLAAIQAPIIMMSQRRQETRDRMRSLDDYKVNLKAELEIRHLHEKIDHLVSKQWQRLAEIQELQIEIMQDSSQRLPAKDKNT